MADDLVVIDDDEPDLGHAVTSRATQPERDRSTDADSRSRRADDLEATTGAFEALAHLPEAEVTGPGAGRLRPGGRQADAVVADLDGRRRFAELDVNARASGPRVLGDVDQRFLQRLLEHVGRFW